MIQAWRTSVFPCVRASTVQRRRDLYSDALEVLDRRHGDPDLSLARVAHEIATSRRQLQRALAEVGVTAPPTPRRPPRPAARTYPSV